MKSSGIFKTIAVLIPFAFVSACGGEADTYTLYRSSVLLENARLHVASFDAADGAKYNDENCQQAQELYQGQPGVKVKFWCEKGRFKK